MGLYAESGHNHGEEEHDHDEHSNELPVYIFQTDDVVLHGFEAQVAWQVMILSKQQYFLIISPRSFYTYR